MVISISCCVSLYRRFGDILILLPFQTGNLGNEALIVTKDKIVYGLGNNIAGCLGTSDAHSTLHPKKIEVLCDKDIKTFAYGSGPHVLALTEKGEVYWRVIYLLN